MSDIRTSYILTKGEARLLLNSMADLQLSMPARYFFDRYLVADFDQTDAAQTLVFKKMARQEGGSLIIEPVMELLLKKVLSANRLWVLKCSDVLDPVFVFRAENMFLLISQYDLIPAAYKITPLQSAADIETELLGSGTVEQIQVVTAQGKLLTINQNQKPAWLGEELDGENIY